MNTKRLFFALWPDARQREALRDPINSVAKSVEGRHVDRRNWHITLAFVGAFPENRIPILHEKAAEIEVEPFRLNLDRMEFWPRPKVAVVTAPVVPPEMQRLVDQIEAALSEVGIRPEERRLRPHITIVRNARSFTTERLARRATTEWSGFDLIESSSMPGGATYTPLKQTL
jgi:2'-5' RNA ligase